MLSSAVLPPPAARIRNQILASLPSNELEALNGHLRRVTLTSGQLLHEANNPILDVFFVEEGIISFTADTHNAGQVEVDLMGKEGFVGVSVLLNSAPIAVHRAFVRAPGFAYCMTAEALRLAVEQSAILRNRCFRQIELMMIQSLQVAACNARHALPDRLARWLLMVRDRMDHDDLPMTQEFMSTMLGVRRSGVSVAATTLEAAGFIQVHRGRVTILDRPGLAEASCDCYHIIQQTRDQLSKRHG